MLPAQHVMPGCLEGSYRSELRAIGEHRLLERLWSKDVSLWPGAPPEMEAVRSSMRWLDLPDEIGRYTPDSGETVQQVVEDGFREIVFVAMGGSNLAARSVLGFASELPPQAPNGPGFRLLDTTEPARVLAVTRSLDLRHTLFIFANRTGKHLETHALLLYFLEQLRAAGVVSPGRHAIAVCDPGSYLSQLAREYRFREILANPLEIGSRFSGLIHYRLLAAKFCGVAPELFVTLAKEMRAACSPAAPGDRNPALALAALLAAAAREGRDEIVLAGPQSLRPLLERIALVVGESTAKRGRGFVPLPAASSGRLPSTPGSLAVTFEAGDQGDPGLAAWTGKLLEEGLPLARIRLHGAQDFGAELFKWEIATALVCARLEVNPFDQPDVMEARARTMEILDRLPETPPADSTVRVREGHIDLHAEGSTRQGISTLNLAEALRSFFELRHPRGYSALLSFLPGRPETEAGLDALERELFDRLRQPVARVSGPRYLHYMGQAFKGGPAKGMFLILTADASEDLAIPGAGYTFGQLHLALAQGDFAALGRRTRPVVRLHFRGGLDRAFTELQSALAVACAHLRDGPG